MFVYLYIHMEPTRFSFPLKKSCPHASSPLSYYGTQATRTHFHVLYKKTYFLSNKPYLS